MSEPENQSPELDEEELKGEEKITVMLRALKSSDILVRSTGAENLAVAAIEEPDMAIPLIIDALKADEDVWWTVRFGAVESLTEMAKRQDKIRLKDGDIDKLIEYLNDEDPDFVGKVAECLSYQGNKKAIEPILEVIDHEVDEVRELTSLALGRLKANVALPKLKENLTDKSNYVQEAVIKAFGMIGENQKDFSIDDITPFLFGISEQLYKAAAGALKRIKNPKSIVPLIRAHDNKNSSPDGREKVIEALEVFSEEEVASAIEKGANDKHEYIDLIEDISELIEYENLRFNADKEKENFIGKYSRDIRRIQSQIDGINAFVSDTFKELSKSDLRKLETILDSIPRKRKLLDRVDFSKVKTYKWVRKELFAEIKSGEEYYKLGNGALDELELAVTLRKQEIETANLT